MNNTVTPTITKCKISNQASKFYFMADIKKLLQRKQNQEKSPNPMVLDIEEISRGLEYSIGKTVQVKFEQQDTATISCSGFSFFDLTFRFPNEDFTYPKNAVNLKGSAQQQTGTLMHSSYSGLDFSGPCPKKGGSGLYGEQVSTMISKESQGSYHFESNVAQANNSACSESEDGSMDDEMMSLMNRYYLNQIRQEEGMEDYGHHSSGSFDSNSCLSIEEGNYGNRHMEVGEVEDLEDDYSEASDFPEEEMMHMMEPSTDEGELSFEMPERVRQTEEELRQENGDFPFALRSEKIPTCKAGELIRCIRYGRVDLQYKYRVRFLQRSKSSRRIQLSREFIDKKSQSCSIIKRDIFGGVTAEVKDQRFGYYVDRR